MISGLRLKFTPEELTNHLTTRAAYHRKRADEKETELPALRDAVERVKAGALAPAADVAHMNKGTYSIGTVHLGDAVESLEGQIKDHRNRALAFSCFADHLFNEAYDLGEADLIRLEILNR